MDSSNYASRTYGSANQGHGKTRKKSIIGGGIVRIQEPCDRRCFEKKEETFRPPSPEVEEIKLTWIRPPCPDSIKITGCNGVEIKHCCAPKKKTHESDEVLNAEDEASVTVSEQKAVEEGEQEASVLENEEGAVNEEN